MKKLTVFFAIAVICCSVSKAQYVNIPDSNFRIQLKWAYPGCFNTAGQMDTTCGEIINAASLLVNYYYVSNYEGLQYFKRLKHLECQYIDSTDIFPSFPDSLVTFICYGSSGLANLPPLPSTLQYFNCSGSYYISSLPALPPGLKRLDCSGCERLAAFPAQFPPSLTYLNVSRCRPYYFSGTPLVLPSLPPGLDTLYCSESNLITLPTLPNGLEYLDCSRNPITSLPAFPNSISYLDCSYFKWMIWNPEDTITIDLPALPSNLKYLNCQSSGLRAMQPLPPGLEKLLCSGVPISSSITFPSTLTWLEIAGCGMHSFPTLADKITYLECSYNPFHTIPSLPDSLTFLSCAGDSLAALPALPPGITYIHCYNNQLTNLPSLPNNLDRLMCSANELTALPQLPGRLTSLECGNNMLTSLPALPDTLNWLQCQGNQLTSLPVLPHFLGELNCQSNQLTYLPDLPASLSNVYCEGNNIYCLPKLPQTGFMFLHIDWKINCMPNTAPNIYIQSYDTLTGMLVSSLPLCNPTNNSSHCQAYPTMQGNVFFDNNNNGTKDANEPLKNNVRVNLSNNAYTFSNNNGQYEIAADSIGNYTLASVAPRYYRYAPASYNFNFINYDTLVTGRNFALQIDSVVDELTVRVTPVNWAARPGFSFPYLISYENTGTTTLSSPNIVFDYDQAKLTYNTSSVVGVVDNANRLEYSTGTVTPGQSGSFIAYFTLNTAVPLGDTLNAKATISANSFTASDSVQSIVRGAFDPNDKQATPQLSPSQVSNGEYIDYTIRFQNTGTDTAFNVVISDTLSDDLQANTLQMITSSHTCKATVKDNIVFFEFINILLPDSNVNEPKSHGFVSFRIKPQTSLSVNTTITNKAAIYFDYNAPVITNTASTLIKEFTVIPLKLVSFTAVPQNGNTTSLYWNTTNEINTKYFIVERSNDGLRFSTVTNVFAKGKANNNYNTIVADGNTGILFYRLKMVDNNGSFAYSPIIKIDKRKNAAGFSILSNPVKDLLVISTTDRTLNNTQASIINLQGAVVKTFIVKEGSQTVDINDMPNGIYYLRTLNGSSRIVIQ